MKSHEIIIQPETKIDQRFIFDVHRKAFKRDEEAILVDHLRKSPAYIPPLSLVAIADHTIVGHILFTDMKINGPGNKTFHALALAPLSVLPDHQHSGIGGLLIRNGLEKATELGYSAVIVLGHEHYYPKFGFVPASKWGIKAPFEVPDNAFMAIELFPGALENAAGMAAYAPEFGIV